MTKQTSDTPTDQKIDGDGNPIQPDVMPEIDDDTVVESRTEPAPAPEPEPAPRQERRPKRKDRRTEIAEMFREMRDKEMKAEETPPAETVDSSESLEAETTPEPTPEQVQTVDDGRNPHAKEVSQETEITLKVDGKEVRKPLAEVISLAQIGMAGENRLDEVKRLLQEAKALRSQPPENPPAPAAEGQQHQPSPAPSQTEPKSTPAPEHPPAAVEIDQDKLRAIAERLQVGDTDEGTQALADYMTEVVAAAQARQPNLDPAQISNWVQDAVLQMQSKAEADAALEKFAERYEPLVKNEDLAITSMTVLTRELMKDLKAAGFRDEDLAANRHDTRTLAHWHRVARQTHRDLRNYDKLLSDVGEYMVKTYNLKIDQPPPSQPSNPQQRTPQQSAQARLERKAALPSQPRSASVRASIDTPPRPKTREDVLNQMRQSRGYASR